MNSSYLSPKTTIKKSPVHGRGLFALKPLKKGEIIAIKGGYIFNKKTLKKIENKIEDSYIQIEKNFYIGSIKKSQLKGNKIFINHSCDPNVGIRGQITFVAMRNIKTGEELTYDWAMENDEKAGPWSLKCNCKKKNCRKIITGNDWKRKDLERKYRNYFSSYILERIIKK